MIRDTVCLLHSSSSYCACATLNRVGEGNEMLRKKNVNISDFSVLSQVVLIATFANIRYVI